MFQVDMDHLETDFKYHIVPCKGLHLFVQAMNWGLETEAGNSKEEQRTWRLEAHEVVLMGRCKQRGAGLMPLPSRCPLAVQISITVVDMCDKIVTFVT